MERIGSEFNITGDVNYHDKSITAIDDNKFLIAWKRYNAPYNIYIQMWQANNVATAICSPVILDESTSRYYATPAIIYLRNKRFAIVFTSTDQRIVLRFGEDKSSDPNSVEKISLGEPIY